MTRSRWLSLGIVAGVVLGGVVFGRLTGEPMLSVVWTYGSVVIFVALITVAVWAARGLRRQPKRSRSSSAPGVSWYPTGMWWGHGPRRDEE